MPKLNSFDPPGFLDDLTPPQKLRWSAWISDQIDAARAGYPDIFDNDGPREQFYNEMKVETAGDAKTADITWIGFPRQVQSASDVARWRRADSSRDLQDEYCEWSVHRDPVTGKVTRVTFTCEGPEYWQYLAAVAPEKAVALYQQFVSPEVRREHLFDGQGRYIVRNPWNSSTSGGAMHLIQRNNTLGAEIELAGGSSVVRVIDGRMLTEPQELIACGQYGAPKRNSDPHIGAVVNELTRLRADVTLANPVGIYFAELLTADWSTPDGTDPQAFWKYVRGTPEKPLRAVYEVPQERGYVTGDVKIRGRVIEYGGQIADFVNMKLTGLACRFGKSDVKPMTGCRTQKAVPEGAFLAGEPLLSVAEALRPAGTSSR